MRLSIWSMNDQSMLRRLHNAIMGNKGRELPMLSGRYVQPSCRNRKSHFLHRDKPTFTVGFYD
jgi:hypothetical protein